MGSGQQNCGNHREETVRRIAMIVLAVTAVALILAGCGDFRDRAQAVEDRIASAEQSASVAETAAAQNTERLLELKGRVDALEAEIDLLHARIPSLNGPDDTSEDTPDLDAL